MGLDNGIILKLPDGKIPSDFPPNALWWVDSDRDIEEHKEMHVAYWRKCWGIRDAILKILHIEDSQGGKYPIEAEDLPAIIKALIEFLKPKYWEEHADSIWEYDEIIDANLQIVINLMWLKNYLLEHKDASVYFYDSY